MSAMTETIENRVLDELFGGATFAIPTQWFLGLLTAAPSDTTSGTEVSTAGGSLYARVSSSNTTANWTNAASGSKVNATTISFPTAGAAWGSVGWVGFYDTSIAGNATLWFWAPLTAAKTISSGDVARFTSGSIVLTAS